MTGRRSVRVSERFFEQLDELFADERSADGDPSATDFLLYEIPSIIDGLATGFESNTLPVDGWPDLRMVITAGLLVPAIVTYVIEADDGAVVLVGLEIQR